jgi:hypothetical protein
MSLPRLTMLMVRAACTGERLQVIQSGNVAYLELVLPYSGVHRYFAQI